MYAAAVYVSMRASGKFHEIMQAAAVYESIRAAVRKFYEIMQAAGKFM